MPPPPARQQTADAMLTAIHDLGQWVGREIGPVARVRSSPTC